jgi:hypothetical protein
MLFERARDYDLRAQRRARRQRLTHVALVFAAVSLTLYELAAHELGADDLEEAA